MAKQFQRVFSQLSLLPYLLLLCFALQSAFGSGAKQHASLGTNKPPHVFTNDFIVEMTPEGPSTAKRAHADWLATKHGFENRGTVVGDDGLYHFRHRALKRTSQEPSLEHIWKLRLSPKVKKVRQLEGYGRLKRGYKTKEHTYQGHDPLYKFQWYINNTGQAGGTVGLDLNVQKAWDMGYTGKGVTVAIMDDGIDYLHPDLRDNYNAEASYDFSSNDPFPYPRYTVDWFNSHGTRCAGEVSSIADNGICGVGVAYNSKIAGIRMLDQPYMTDVIEAASMSYKPNLIDIYSASWGPTDDGRTVDGPRELTLRAIVDGVNKGRNGLGSIYVWASGDGGADDDCNCDGYAASMWTISVNSAINDGETALYDESCSSTLASTFSNGRGQRPGSGVATTDLYGQCTLRHSGTSAAAPEAAGVFALALDANKNLTWRDMQHLTVLTSTPKQLHDNLHQWKRNGVGLFFNHLFGFGVLNAERMVKMASTWKTVPARFRCEGGLIETPFNIPSDGALELTIDTDACDGKPNHIRYLEHVQAFITLESSRRGDVTINLTSPMGTNSMLLNKRPNDDDSTRGFRRWPFMTTHTWGEDPRGEWKLSVSLNSEYPQEGRITRWALLFHGTQKAPYIDEIVDNLNSKLAISKKLEYAEGILHDLVDEQGDSDTNVDPKRS
uniref:Neuroendocrine convertase 2 n=1 Tax=Phallusia mammillata TaxID=59560 RepID=A0A6F9DP02_9ASCI|nr:CiPC2 Neuroendocrine convertase 2-like [Phallusia mammillata]